MLRTPISSLIQQIFVDSHHEPKYFLGTRDAVVNRAEKALALINSYNVIGRDKPESIAYFSWVRFSGFV